MNVIVPLNIQALRVNEIDASDNTPNFKGGTAQFSELPYVNNPSTKPSTGSAIYQPLTSSTSLNVQAMEPGIHLHWNLPEYFKKGKQNSEKEKIEFPQVHNRWLVTRFLSVLNSTTKKYEVEGFSTKSWVVESDFLSPTPIPGARSSITVPLQPNPSNPQPYMYMGRCVDYDTWITESKDSQAYLPHYKDQNDNPRYLDSIGFVGSYFSSYYPECSSVFGFYDDFKGTSVYDAVQNGGNTQFRVSYNVIGWVNDASLDPVNNFNTLVTEKYNDYANACKAKNVTPELTPTDFFSDLMKEDTKWSLNDANISYTLDSKTHKIDTLNVPSTSICSGIVQEIVWNMEENNTNPFLGENDGPVITSPGSVSIGNTSTEAFAALLKEELGGSADPTVKNDYELMLDALQLGLLKDLEQTPDILIGLEEKLHSQSFDHQNGGLVWNITHQKKSSNETLDDSLATLLHTLNEAQKDYDMARFGLFIKRKQLFMDWLRYVDIFCHENINGTNPYKNIISMDSIQQYLYNNATKKGEITDVVNEAKSIGLLTYKYPKKAPNGNAISVTSTSETTSKAQAVVTAFNNLYSQISGSDTLLLHTEALDSFHTPSDPVVLLESEALDPHQRQPLGGGAFVRFTNEILSEIEVKEGTNTFTVTTDQIGAVTSIPQIPTTHGVPGDVQTLINEVYLLCPMLAQFAATALKNQAGTNNPAVSDYSDFTAGLMYAQGGLSPLDFSAPGGIASTNQQGLFDIIAGDDSTLKNNAVTVTSPKSTEFTFTFTNSNNEGYVMSPFGWNTQKDQKQLLSEGITSRYDPFIPLFIIWEITMNPLKKLTPSTPSQKGYQAENITKFFEFDHDDVDYQYLAPGGTAKDFTDSGVTYTYSATLSPNAGGSLIHEINSYKKNNPHDDDTVMLNKVITNLTGKKLISQRMSSFNNQQILTKSTAGIPVQNLVFPGSQDSITYRLQQDADNANDNWYTNRFNRVEPISIGTLAETFGPLRAGFASISKIEIVDIYGQRVDIKKDLANNTVDCTPSYSLSPVHGDTANEKKIFLPPRLLSPTRLWFKWLSAANNLSEMTKNPTTNPINGWVVPNHLDGSLMFYNANGSGIGSFHVDGSSTLAYNTWPGNPSGNSLTTDIGAQGAPKPGINAHLANFMWYIDKQGTANYKFFKDLMATIQKGESTNIPKEYQQSESLSVLMGTPLAIVRTELGFETPGKLLPLNQSCETSTGIGAFAKDISKSRFTYEDRIPYSSANLGSVNIPVQLGNLAHFNDGLIAYLLEGSDATNPYKEADFYAPAAPSDSTTNVKQPDLSTIEMQLNEEVISATLLMDPRSYVHATTGVLPVKKLKLPTDFYKTALQNISVSFYTRPVLRGAIDFVIPIPEEKGYEWQWIVEGQTVESIASKEVSSTPKWGYSQQEIFEGWLNLKHKD